MKYSDIIKFNTKYETYGNSFRIKKNILRFLIISIAGLLPIINVVVGAIIAKKYIKKDLVWRY